ncbi:MAG: PTS transporter subunit EIIC [Erysipelotrichaceae bacterium]|nr:PTS transporter subunit EIIC [Erysipelotrichaceae bacterium]
MAKYTEFCNQILENVGGKDNITGALHCMTRLRLNVKDRSKVNIDAIKELKGAIGAQFSGDQFQVIIGQHVSQVYSEFCAIAGIGTAEAIEENLDKEKFNIKQIPSKILDYVSGSLAPIIPIMTGVGFCKMFYALLGPDLLNLIPKEAQLMQILYIVGESGFYFLPIFVAWSAAKKLNTSIPLTLLMGALLIDPNILKIVSAGEPFHIYGLFPMPLNNYAQSLIPILLVAWLMKYIYQFFIKVMPDSIKVIGVPFFTIIVMIPLMFCVLAPLGNSIGILLAGSFETLYNVAGPLTIALIAAFWPFLVATGMHVAFISIAKINIATLGMDPIVLAAGNIANYALMGMVVAYFLRAKNEEKQMAGANVVTLIVGGISEPTLFGILLRNKKAMLTQITGGFIGGLVGGLLGVAVYILGTGNFLTVLQYAGGPGSNFINACIACAVAFIASLTVGLIMGFGSTRSGLQEFKGKKALKKIGSR